MWRLDVYYPDGSQAASYSPSSPGGIVGAIRWASYPTGGTVRIMLDAIPSMTTLPPRGIAVLHWQDQPVAAGVIVRTWPTWDGHVRTYELATPRYIMQMRQTGERFYKDTPVATIVSDMVALRPTNIMDAYVPTIPDTVKMTLTIRGSVQAGDVLSRILPSVGLTWDVLPDWPLRLTITSTLPGVRTIPYRDGILTPASVDWTGVPDRVDALVLLPEHDLFYYSYCTREMREYLTYPVSLGTGWAESAIVITPAPIIYSSGPSHIRAFANHGATDINNAVDGDPSTYASNSLADGFLSVRVVSAPEPIIGMAVYGKVNNDGSFGVALGYVYAATKMPTTYSAMRHVISARLDVAPECSRERLNDGASVPWKGESIGAVRIYEFYVLSLDTAAVESTIRSIYTPATAINGGEVRLARYEPPAGALSVQGSPYGDVSGPVETVEYEISPEAGIRTVYRLGRTNDLVRELTQRSAVDLSSTSRLTGGIL